MAGTVVNKENKGIFVAEFVDKAHAAGYFLVKEKVFRTGKNGKSFLSFQLADRTGTVDARVWDNAEALQLIVQTGDVVQVRGLIQVFQSRLQLVVHKMERVAEPEVEPGLLVTASRQTEESMETELLTIVSRLSNAAIRELILQTLSDPQVRQRLLIHPAAKTIHHAYRSGLLEHILSIAKLMQAIHAHYTASGVDMDLDYLIFGAIFHDLGKIWELEGEGPYQYSYRGRLVGHMAIALEMIDAKVIGIPDMDLRTLDKLKHIILSHHGKLEYGSPKEPMFLEAALVAMVDEFDSKVAALTQFISAEKAGGAEWSRLHPQLNRYFLLR